MLLKEVAYYRPTTVEEALQALEEVEDAQLLAGGQSLLNVMKLRLAAPSLLVDLNGVEELRFIHLSGDGAVEMGAMATYDQIAGHRDLRQARPTISEVAQMIGDVQVRNRGTLGGNLCQNDPTSNFPPLVVGLDATLKVIGPDGPRTIPAGEFFRGFYTTALKRGEILRSVTFPPLGQGWGEGYSSLRPIGHERGLVNASAAVGLSNGTVEALRVAVGGVAGAPVRAKALEEALKGQSPTEAAVREAAARITPSLNPPSDAHATAEYRRRMATVYAARAVLTAVDRAGG